MASYLISYDLRKPGQDYAELFKAIKALGSSWWHCLDSTWIVKHDGPTATIRDALTPHIDSNDKLIVVKLTGDWASWGLDKDCNDWLRNNL